MKIDQTKFSGVYLIENDVYADHRGAFTETYNQQKFREVVGINPKFVQDNQAWSTKGALRGVHYQHQRPQAKLVRCSYGEIYDVIVDLRTTSDTFGEWLGFTLSKENGRQLWIPEGFAHGYKTISDSSLFQYKLTDHRNVGDEYCLAWNDPTVDIIWPDMDHLVLSDKDQQGDKFENLPYFN